MNSTRVYSPADADSIETNLSSCFIYTNNNTRNKWTTTAIQIWELKLLLVPRNSIKRNGTVCIKIIIRSSIFSRNNQNWYTFDEKTFATTCVILDSGSTCNNLLSYVASSLNRIFTEPPMKFANKIFSESEHLEPNMFWIKSFPFHYITERFTINHVFSCLHSTSLSSAFLFATLTLFVNK